MDIEKILPPIMFMVIVGLIVWFGYTAIINEKAKWSELDSKYNLSEYPGYEEDGYAYLSKDNKTWVIAYNSTEGYYLCDMAVCGDPFLKGSILPCIAIVIIASVVIAVVLSLCGDKPKRKKMRR
jgi:hypothetical protein